MPVSTGSTSNTLQQQYNNNNNNQQSTNNQSTNDEPRAKRCKHCDDASHRSVGGGDTQGGLWRIPLDADLLATIAAVYPDWFKEKQPTNNNNNNITNGNNNNNSIHNMADGGGGGGGASSGNGATSQQQPPLQNPSPPDSPPKAIVDTSPLQNAMDKNKESLKVKLMLRRPINQLVAQGIMPPLKTPPAYHEQRRQLERAKTGDILQKKIQQRPSRTELEQRHILDSQSKVPVDPSLADRQRMLKKARLADQLNDQLSHRPGPLELIQKNILHTEEPIEQAVKAGKIPFKATCEGQATRPQHPNSYVSVDDDSQSSEGGSVSTNDVIESAAKSAGIVVSLVTPTQNSVAPVTTASFTFAELCKSVTAAAGLLPLAPAPSPAPSSSMSPLSSLASPQTPQTPLTPRTQPSPAPGKDKNRKKSKLKSAPKTRTIKFHEYKGPPNAQKNSSSSNNNNISNETSYELLLQQQQLFLQWQLEWQHKYPQIILPATQKNPDTDSCSNSSIPNGSPPSSVSSTVSDQQTQIVNVVPKPLGRLEDKKVSDLKAELKKRNLPVSGSKPQLIERLRPFTEPVTHSGHIIMDTPPPPTPSAEDSQEEDSHSQASPASDMGMDIVPESPAPTTNEDIVREQQRKIEELQRELTKSQLQLQQVRDGVQSTAGQKLQHYVRARQDLKRQQHAVFQNAKNVAVANGLSAGVVLNGPQAALILNQLQKAKLVANGQTANFIVPAAVITTATTTTPQELLQQVTQQQNQLQQLQQSQQMQQNQQQIQQNHQIQQNQQIQQSQQLQQQEMQTAQQTQVASPMSNQFNDDQPSLSPASNSELENNNIKSQIVDDIFEILIKNGELPPNAANEILIKNGELPVNPVNDSTLPNHHDSHDSLQNGVPSPQSINSIVQPDTVPASPHSPLAGLDELLHANSNDDLKDLAHDLDTFFDFPTLDSDQTSQNKEQHDNCNMKFNCNSPDVEFDCNTQDVKFGCDPTTVKFGQPDMKFDNMADIKFECNTSDINFNCNSPDNQNISDVKFGCNIADVKFGHNINEMKFGQDSINHNQNSISSQDELMDVDMGMDMDEDGQDWLGSLIPSEPSSVPIQTLNMSSLMQTQSLCNDFSIPAGYDPLLGHSLHDPLDFFGLDEFRTNGDLQSNNNSTPMSWDKLDFAA